MSENTHPPAPHGVTVDVGGRTLTLETGKIAKQANGAIVARYGDTVVLTTACMAPTTNDRDFLPLTVDYRENTYSAGKIPGGFFKREGRPSEKEVLTSRLIDRPMRPLFPESWRNETQVVSMVLSADSENDPDVIAVTSASDRKSTRLNSSHSQISYAVFCLKKKKPPLRHSSPCLLRLSPAYLSFSVSARHLCRVLLHFHTSRARATLSNPHYGLSTALHVSN